MKLCYKCNNPWQGYGQPGIREKCEKCSSELHVCRNCRFFNEHKPYCCECVDVDPVTEKERANFCEEFQFSDKKQENLPAGSGASTKAKDAWNKLFKK